MKTWSIDALGCWAEKVENGTATQGVYDPTGALLVLANGSTLADARVPTSGGAIAQYVDGALSAHWHPDWLGTSRVVSTTTQTLAVDAAFAPFGEQYVNTSSFDSTWTGSAYKDKATDLRDLAAREYHPIQGRFLTPDPAGLAAVDPTNPQSWNRYAYVMNNPLSFVDPSGAIYCAPQGPESGTYYCVSNDDYNADPDSYPGWVEYEYVQSVTVSDAEDQTPLIGPPPPPPGDLVLSPVQATSGNSTKPTFSQCMAANSSAFSIAGVLQGAANTVRAANGSPGWNFRDIWWVQAALGNGVSGLLFGSATDAGMSAGGYSPGIVQTAMGTGITYGRRTATIMALNLAGKGGLPQALSSASAEVNSLLNYTNVLSLGLDFTQKLLADATLATAEAAYCAYAVR